ncbi:Succinate dehydrogenase assembly factor 4 protein [Dioscorea alata]|uniref:Succinate dehydrogenase assembly factor 4 protein n=3 Tax=Dioscorea alata TaxID=55571 RepID=A0ACB7UCV1_DIOAL|nr:Succinate dehydrogenase assembly factor 4 protein [Dioscorea alata]KAH7658158.1 Succinate dehydrogenase assembly factor 4 protein [Dioscorea alata]KAH7658159.1 Succinate dehydrogenase assembly factor 4 protein [Dioscorea alata]
MANKLLRLLVFSHDIGNSRVGLVLGHARSLSSSSSAPPEAELRAAVEDEKKGEAKNGLGSEGRKGDGEEEEGDDDNGGVHVNKVTGEVGGPRGPEPTRYGDWERGGRCSDF